MLVGAALLYKLIIPGSTNLALPEYIEIGERRYVEVRILPTILV